MKEFIKQDFLNNSCNDFNSQPEGLKQIIAESFEENFNGKIQFYDYFGEPLIFSHKDKAFYIFQNNTLNQISFKSQNDLFELNLNDFNQKFDGLGDKLSDQFKQKAGVENNFELLLDENTQEKYFQDLLKDFNKQEQDQILKKIELLKSNTTGDYLENGISMYAKTLFLAIKSIENGGKFEEILDIVSDNISNELNILLDLYSVALISDLFPNIVKLIIRNSDNLKLSPDNIYFTEINKILEYITSNIFALPPKVKSRLHDLQKLKDLKESL